MKSPIFLHIGQGKTGTSAIQAALARNHDALKARGLLYPEHGSFAQARAGQVTSGNLDPENWFEGQVMPAVRAAPGHPAYLFSNEHLLYRMDEFFERVGRYRDDYRFEIILFVRNPIESLASTYQQAVKRGGYAGSIRAFAEHEAVTPLAASAVERLDRAGIAFTLFNYSVTLGDTVARFFGHLGMAELVAAQRAAKIVNRSLSRAELEFVRYVNQIFGAHHGTLVADALVNELPDVAAERVEIDQATRDYVRARNGEAMDLLNRFLPASERLTFDMADDPAGATPHSELSTAQSAVIARMFPGVLTPADGIVLRDIAMKYDDGAALTREDAIALMEYARKARPTGQIIAGALKRWKDGRDAG